MLNMTLHADATYYAKIGIGYYSKFSYGAHSESYASIQLHILLPDSHHDELQYFWHANPRYSYAQ